jgi:hypothetical protein
MLIFLSRRSFNRKIVGKGNGLRRPGLNLILTLRKTRAKGSKKTLSTSFQRRKTTIRIGIGIRLIVTIVTLVLIGIDTLIDGIK